MILLAGAISGVLNNHMIAMCSKLYYPKMLNSLSLFRYQQPHRLTSSSSPSAHSLPPTTCTAPILSYLFYIFVCESFTFYSYVSILTFASFLRPSWNRAWVGATFYNFIYYYFVLIIALPDAHYLVAGWVNWIFFHYLLLIFLHTICTSVIFRYEIILTYWLLFW